MKCFDIDKLSKAIALIEQMQEEFMFEGLQNEGKNDPRDEDHNGEAHMNGMGYDDPEYYLCLQLIEDVLKDARSEAEAMMEKRRAAREPFPYYFLDNYEANAKPRTVTQTLRSFAALTDDAERRMIGAVKVNQWLQAHGYIDRIYIDEIEKEDWYPTESGSQVGINAAKSEARGQAYMRITYDQRGQMFLAEHLEEIENEMLYSE